MEIIGFVRPRICVQEFASDPFAAYASENLRRIKIRRSDAQGYYIILWYSIPAPSKLSGPRSKSDCADGRRCPVHPVSVVNK